MYSQKLKLAARLGKAGVGDATVYHCLRLVFFDGDAGLVV